MNRHMPGWRVLALVAIAALGACSGKSNLKSEGGDLTLIARGGEGLDGYGGTGGYFDVENYAAGDAKVLRWGTVNTDFTVPSTLPYLGTHPVDVTANTTLSVEAPGTAGLHLEAESAYVYDGSDAVTGIRVRPGATLTFEPNLDGSGYDGLRDTVYLELDDGLIVEGTVRVATQDATDAGDGEGADTANFHGVYVGAVWVASSGRIDLTGASSTSAAGANGGWFDVHPDFFFNAGTIDTSGGSGSDGAGNGGGVYVYSQGGLVNTGTLLANGGAGGTGAGGDAGSFDLETTSNEYDLGAAPGFSSGYAYVISSGTVSGIGGDGATRGGDGAHTDLYTNEGDLLLAGSVRTYGGNATDDGPGGDGGALESNSSIYGAVRVAGTIDTHGGAGAGVGAGGTGGYVSFDLEPKYSAGADEIQANSQVIAFGANVVTSGGSGATGGSAGYFFLDNCEEGDSGPGGSPITLVGYRTIDLSGGDGSTYGGDAGSDNYLDAWGDNDYSDVYYAGNVANEADFVMRGGAGKDGYGGDGAGLELETDSGIYAPYNYGVTNSGLLDGSGGDGTTYGGDGGYFSLYGKFFVKNTGAIIASGGFGETDSGGYAGDIELSSEGPITSAGALTANGGASDSGSGAYGSGRDYSEDGIFVQTADVCTVSAPITASGGASVSGTPGDGGSIVIQSQAAPSVISAALTAAAGAGTAAEVPPEAGYVVVDGEVIAGP